MGSLGSVFASDEAEGLTMNDIKSEIRNESKD